MKIYLIRHGETGWNKKRKLQGKSDITLNEYGRNLAEVTAEALRDVDFQVVYTSPLSRAKETAEILRRNRSIDIIEDKRLEELGFGVGEGKNIDDIRNQPGIKLYNFLCNPEEYLPPRGGESFIELHKRCQSFIDDILIPSEGKYESMLISGHGALIRGIVNCVDSVPLKDFWRKDHKNCAVTIIECVDGKLSILEEAKLFYDEKNEE